MPTCPYCKKKFKRACTMYRHQRNAKYCITIQSSIIENKDDPKFNNTIDNDFVQTIKTLINSNADMVKIVQGVINKKESSTNKKSTDSLKPITDNDIVNCINSLSIDFIIRGAKGLADFAGNYPFKDKVICTDKARRKIKYKNEDGSINTDGKALAQRFLKAILEKNTSILNDEYAKLHRQIDTIVSKNSAGEEDVTTILEKAIRVQNILIQTKNAANGDDMDFIEEFLRHLSKLL